MDISMDFKSFNSYQKIYSGENVCKLSADAVIPDTYNDIARLLNTEFSCKIISKDSLFGKVTVSGEVEATSVFVSEEMNSPSVLRTVMPFSAEFSSDAVESSTIPVVAVKIIASDWRELNPRKIGLNADVLVSLGAYNKAEMSFPAVPTETEAKAFFKTESRIINYISFVSEKLTTLDDEHEAENAEEVISANTDYFSDSFELIGSRLIVKGHSHSRVLYRKNDGKLSSMEYDTPFSQLFDSEEDADIADISFVLLPAGEYYELIDGAISMELRVVSQLVCYESKEITCVTDAYACGCEYELTAEKKQIAAVIEKNKLNKAVTVSYDLPADAASVFVSSVKFGKIAPAGNGINVPLIINAIYSDKDNNLYSFRVRDNVEFEDVQCDNAEVFFESVNYGLLGGKAQFETKIMLRYIECRADEVSAVTAMSVNTDKKPAECPSLYIVRAEDNDIWNISKKYGADQNRIIAINEISGEEDIRGRMLLIPKI